MNEQEIWKDVVGFENYYEVSSLGRVKTKRIKQVRNSRSGWPYTYELKEKQLRLFDTRGGYLRVNLCERPTKVISKYVHSLVAEAFIGPRPEGLNIDHLNGYRKDNRPENLEYVTQRENCGRGKAGDKYQNKSCKLRGVTKKRGGFQATKSWSINGKPERFHLGTYDTAAEAHEVYLRSTYEDAVEIKKCAVRGHKPLRHLLTRT